MKISIGNRVTTRVGEFKKCIGYVIDDIKTNMFGQPVYTVEFPYNNNSSKVGHFLREDLDIIEYESGTKEMSQQIFSKSMREYFGIPEDYFEKKSVPIMKKPISFTKEELMDILSQDKSADQILLDMRDHITN